jgi:hypothetical protein
MWRCENSAQPIFANPTMPLSGKAFCVFMTMQWLRKRTQRA